VVLAFRQRHQDVTLDLPVTADLIRDIPGRVLRTRYFHSTQPLAATPYGSGHETTERQPRVQQSALLANISVSGPGPPSRGTRACRHVRILCHRACGYT